jgi:hypothetical protein
MSDGKVVSKRAGTVLSNGVNEYFYYIRQSWHYLRQQAGGRSDGIVRSRTQATEFFVWFYGLSSGT